ncbi:MAG: phosphatidate cytidylyltransferase, partial [Longimicrobiales bacterium]
MIESREFWLVLSAVAGALVAASAAGYVLHRRARSGNARAVVENLNARIKAWWVMVALVAGALLAGPKAVILLFALVSFGALREFITLTRTRQADHRAVFASFFLAIPGQYYLIAIEWYGLFAVYI